MYVIIFTIVYVDWQQFSIYHNNLILFLRSAVLKQIAKHARIIF